MSNLAPEFQRLQDMQADLSSRLDRVRRDLHRTEAPIPADFEEQAVEVENLPVLEALEDAMSQDLAQVNHAIERYRHGLYALCERCGGDIEPARRQVFPDATICMKCLRQHPH